MGYSVNFVWNYCNQSNAERWAKFRKTFSAFDLNKLTIGYANDLGVHSQTVQAMCEEYAKACKQFRKTRLSWRSRKRSLGWIRFKATGVKVQADSITYNGYTFRFWKSRPVTGTVRIICSGLSRSLVRQFSDRVSRKATNQNRQRVWH
ncbi:hypothetical protein GCM10027347_59940 [Larkinella harenae]